MFKRFQAVTSCLIGFCCRIEGWSQQCHTYCDNLFRFKTLTYPYLFWKFCYTDLDALTWWVGMSISVCNLDERLIAHSYHCITVLTNSKVFAIVFQWQYDNCCIFVWDYSQLSTSCYRLYQY